MLGPIQLVYGKCSCCCGSQLVKDTSPEAMSQLREALAQVHEHVFIYDRNYVADYLGWQDLLLDTSVLHEAASSEAAYPPEAAGGATETAPALASGAGVPDGSSSQQVQCSSSAWMQAGIYMQPSVCGMVNCCGTTAIAHLLASPYSSAPAEDASFSCGRGWTCCNLLA